MHAYATSTVSGILLTFADPARDPVWIFKVSAHVAFWIESICANSAQRLL